MNFEEIKNEFFKIGYSEEESEQLAELTLKFKSTVTTDISVEEATSCLVTVLKEYDKNKIGSFITRRNDG